MAKKPGARQYKPLAQTVKLSGVVPGTKEYKNLYRRVRRMQNRGYIFNEQVPVGSTTNLYEVSVYVDPITGVFIKGTVRLHQERKAAARKGWETRRQSALREAADEAERVALLINANELDSILDNIRMKIEQWTPKEEWKVGKGTFEKVKNRDKDKLKSLLDLAILTEGVEAVARRLEEHATMVNLLAEQILYGGSGGKKDSDYMQGELAEFAEILTGGSLNLDGKKALEQQIESFMPA